MGVSRPDLAVDLRSAAFEDYVIFFRYAEDRFEVVNIVEGHRYTHTLYRTNRIK